MKKSDKLSIILTFFDEAVATKARQKLLMVLFCGIGATLFSTGIVIGTTKIDTNQNQEKKLERNTEKLNKN